MDWMVATVSAIAFIRLTLIFSGLVMLLRCITRTRTLDDNHKRCFAISGIIYLLGLMPQSLLLLLTNSTFGDYILDSGYLCWIQKFTCIVAVGLQSFIFLDWISKFISYHPSDTTHSGEFLRRKEFVRVMVFYLMLLITCRVFYLKSDEGQQFYTDVAARTDNTSSPEWTFTPVKVVRLQLLLCESSMPMQEMKHFLTASYILLLLPFTLVCYILKPIITQKKQTENANKICHPDSNKGKLISFNYIKI